MLCDEQHTWVICNWSYWLLTRSVLPSFWENEYSLRFNFLTCLCTVLVCMGLSWLVKLVQLGVMLCDEQHTWVICNWSYWLLTRSVLPSFCEHKQQLYKTIILKYIESLHNVLYCIARFCAAVAMIGTSFANAVFDHSPSSVALPGTGTALCASDDPAFPSWAIDRTVMNMYELQYPSMSSGVLCHFHCILCARFLSTDHDIRDIRDKNCGERQICQAWKKRFRNLPRRHSAKCIYSAKVCGWIAWANHRKSYTEVFWVRVELIKSSSLPLRSLGSLGSLGSWWNCTDSLTPQVVVSYADVLGELMEAKSRPQTDSDRLRPVERFWIILDEVG